MDSNALQETLTNARELLISSRDHRGAFCGELSSSALSTATASMAFSMSARAVAPEGRAMPDHERLAVAGQAWLCQSQNDDGGWGDMVDSPSNISTTILCWVCLGMIEEDRDDVVAALAKANDWLEQKVGELTPERLAKTIRARYGEDRTFSVPILTTCALGGRLGEHGWRFVPALPFELAALPHRWFGRLGLPTVSYALPALIAIGQVGHHHRPTRNPVTRFLRNITRRRTLGILAEIQPASGGFLEAAPLTSFVSMSLLSMGLNGHEVVEKGLRFLAETVREDGSWPIDTNLDTWLTTLSVNALGDREAIDDVRTRDWLLGQQYACEHPYTHAAPGGWAWTDLSGGVPDADDTAGAVLALRGGFDGDPRIIEAASRGIEWLIGLQNRDGGIPTFCRGWGKLPFDRSSPDLAAHTLRAIAAWREQLSGRLLERADRAMAVILAYLLDGQRADGAWIPLWFGNQDEPGQENPIYGTSRVLRALVAGGGEQDCDRPLIEARNRAVGFLLMAQQPDGSFGKAGTIEETALAIEALAEWAARSDATDDGSREAIAKGVAWLVEKTDCGRRFPASPIGLYFAQLWYSERLYPLIFTVSAIELAGRCAARPFSKTPAGG